MSIKVVCGNCHREYQVKDEFAGRRFKCKQCSQVIQVTASITEEQSTVDHSDEKDEKTVRSRRPLLLIIGGASALLLIVSSVLWFFFFSSGPSGDVTTLRENDTQATENGASPHQRICEEYQNLHAETLQELKSIKSKADIQKLHRIVDKYVEQGESLTRELILSGVVSPAQAEEAVAYWNRQNKVLNDNLYEIAHTEMHRIDFDVFQFRNPINVPREFRRDFSGALRDVKFQCKMLYCLPSPPVKPDDPYLQLAVEHDELNRELAVFLFQFEQHQSEEQTLEKLRQYAQQYATQKHQLKSLKPDEANIYPPTDTVEDSLTAALRERTNYDWHMLNGGTAMELAENSTGNRAVQTALTELFVAILE